ncbi:uncharacterized protein LOC128679020 isoform X2 [Plodia interpunctella]|uniref:uncharacterized protein LOC128679020 isoform X2 n=1 Tax=Plodia interpunctella TaxID=58824 RepID=UPI002367AF84|nr:uncharacterized protein LOC128679020 isoform X2 [Plodia interpunctella]
MVNQKKIYIYIAVSRQWQQFKPQIYKQEYNSDEIYNRLITVMQTIHREGRMRHENLDLIRFFYEKTPYYEMGYVMGEIIERYRKMVTHVRRRHNWKSTHVHYMIRKVQTIQHLYFEIFHLCGMMHEIDLKYSNIKQFANIHAELSMKDMAKLQQEIDQEVLNKEKARKKALKKDLKQRKKLALQMNAWPKWQKNKTVEKSFWHPYQYGWDYGIIWSDKDIPSI